MVRGTTPKITISVEGTNLNDYVELEVSFRQRNTLIVKKLSKGELIVSDDNSVVTKLTQEETLRFACEPVRVQLRCLTEDGMAVSGEYQLMRVKEALNEEVLEVGDDNG